MAANRLIDGREPTCLLTVLLKTDHLFSSFLRQISGMANEAYSFRLYPDQEQQQFLGKCFSCSRFVYNYYLCLSTGIYAHC